MNAIFLAPAILITLGTLGAVVTAIWAYFSRASQRNTDLQITIRKGATQIKLRPDSASPEKIGELIETFSQAQGSPLPGKSLDSPTRSSALKGWWYLRSTAEKTALIVSGGVVLITVLASVLATFVVTAPPTRATVTSPRPNTIIHVHRPGTLLHALGTVQNLRSGHQLVLFLQFQGLNRYWLGNPVIVRNGRWSGTTFLGAPGEVTLIIVDAGPQALKAIDKDVPYENNGFPTLNVAPDITILDFVRITAIPYSSSP